MIGLDAPVTTYGTLNSATVCSYADVTALEYPPMRISTLSSVMSLVTAFCPPSRVDSSSPCTSLMGIFALYCLTKIPPFALISSVARTADCHMFFPILLFGPVMDTIAPILISFGCEGACACCVHPAKNAAVSTNAMKRTVYFMVYLLCYDIAYQIKFQSLTL